MKGVVTDENGEYVKAAVIKLFKIQDLSDEQDSDDDSETEAVTYAETDEEGRFVIRDLNPNEKYFIEIHVALPEKSGGKEAPDPIDEADDAEEEISIIDSLESFSVIDDMLRGSISSRCSCNISGYDYEEKSYLKKSNLW